MCEYTGEYQNIIQIHHQFRDGKTVMVAQKEINNIDEMRVFARETAKSHPLPEGTQWFFCNEKSRHFVVAVDPSEAVVVS